MRTSPQFVGANFGAHTAALVENVDIYPTVCDLAGLPASQGLDGRSFAATLRDPSVPTKESIIHVFPRGELIGRAIRTARYRLVEWKKSGAAPDTAILELYDYEADPAETKNLAAEQPEVVAKLRAILANHPEAKPQLDGNRVALFTKKDKDSDGKLTREEFLAEQNDPQEAPKRFERFDANKDGILSRDEFVTMGNTAGR